MNHQSSVTSLNEHQSNARILKRLYTRRSSNPNENQSHRFEDVDILYQRALSRSLNNEFSVDMFDNEQINILSRRTTRRRQTKISVSSIRHLINPSTQTAASEYR